MKMQIEAKTSGTTMMITSMTKAMTRRAKTPSNSSGFVIGSWACGFASSEMPIRGVPESDMGIPACYRFPKLAGTGQQRKGSLPRSPP
jgi:hypothetical protein